MSHLAALLALLALGVALGDFASRPNLLGGLAIPVLFALLALALWRLYRDGGVAGRRTARAGVEADGSAETEQATTTVTATRPSQTRRPLGSPGSSGWDAREAAAARERRREERARRRRGGG